MKKEVKKILLFLILILNQNLFATDKFYVLYGIKLGQKMAIASEMLGKPFKSEKFPDGFRYEAFKINDHIVIVEANNTRPDLIWGIQIQGNSNPANLGINGLNLSDNDSKIIELFGKPDEIRDSIDELTGKKMPGIQFYSYDKTSNFSIETTNHKVSSIKITFSGYNLSDENYEIKEFIDILKSKDLYKISSNISSDFILKSEKEFNIQKSIVETLNSKNEISDLLLYSQNGLTSITEKSILEKIPIKNKENTVIAYYFRVMIENKNVHIFFLRSFEGWILKEINLNQ
ncbi:hypothetical protein EHR01_14170 [Leptospira mtsangambouensis]|uniref:Uncharacterized protein n=1 Tax=Leptospira mtsangambouensis TaxID=2484912 RepID=A0ABY2NV31_9LEPT|nr:hypothetical protein [Leptospira mtsangambouensis]TGM72404.1 hypothetical protein EHR01_14170 [Leptospira mtsangambouensis]